MSTSNWVVVSALSVTVTTSFGVIYYGFPVFLRPMEEEFRASRVAVTGAFSIGLAVSALLAIPVGKWLDRHGARGIMTGGSCLGALLLFAWARVEGLVGLYVVWCLMGVAMAATFYEPAFAAIVQRFSRGRDRALLVLTLCGALASTIFMPLATWLLGRLGWRAAIVALAIVFGVVTIPLHALVLGRPAGGRAHASGRTSPVSDLPGMPLGNALRTVIFWVLDAAFVVGNFSTISVTVHMIPYLTDRGYSAAFAAATLGWIGVTQLAGRLLFVPIAPRLRPASLVGAIFLAQAAGIGALAVVGGLPTLALMVFLFGAANGMSTLARATVIAEIFGRRAYGSIGGAIALGSNGARALGPVGASLLHAGLGSYERLFWMLAGALGLVGLAVYVTDARRAATTGLRDLG